MRQSIGAFGTLRNLSLAAVAIVLLGGCESPAVPIEEISVQEIPTDQGDVTLTPSPVSYESTDWPGWRGASQNGIAADQPIVTEWGPDKNILWSADVPGRGHASPVVVGDLVVLATAIEATQQQRIVAFDRTTGQPRWDTLVHEGGFPGPKKSHKKGTNANGTVATDGERIFIPFLNNNRLIVTALDLEGEQVWQRDVGPFLPLFGYACSPILHKSNVIISGDFDGGGFLAAINRESGEIVWRKERPKDVSFSTATVAKVNDRDQLLIEGCNLVASYDPATGEELWTAPGTARSTCGTMVTDGTLVFASGGFPEKQMIAVYGDGSGKIAWQNKTNIYEPSMLVTDGSLFAVSDRSIAYCWNAADGELLWQERLEGGFSASPVLCNGLLLVPSLAGETYVFKASRDGYEQIARNKLGDDTYASLAIADGKIFIRAGHQTDDGRQERLYCVGEK